MFGSRIRPRCVLGKELAVDFAGLVEEAAGDVEVRFLDLGADHVGVKKAWALFDRVLAHGAFVRNSGKYSIKKTLDRIYRIFRILFLWSLLPHERETERPPAVGKTSRVPPEPTRQTLVPKLLYCTAMVRWTLFALRPAERKTILSILSILSEKNIGQDLRDL